MKKIFSLLLLLTWGIIAWNQQTPGRDVQAEKERYLRKSRTQNIAGWILVSAGAVCLIAPSLDGGSEQNNEEGWFNFSGLERTLDTYAYLTGVVLAGGGIGLLVASAGNRKKAAAISIVVKTEKAEFYTLSAGHRKIFPAAGIRIQFN
ncbi:MAG: hypothetical protein JNK14_17785 [Chitinophagaceae bacterium]|nr:hypothetical protein [Chitinophagaceae bacterium]